MGNKKHRRSVLRSKRHVIVSGTQTPEYYENAVCELLCSPVPRSDTYHSGGCRHQGLQALLNVIV